MMTYDYLLIVLKHKLIFYELYVHCMHVPIDYSSLVGTNFYLPEVGNLCVFEQLVTLESTKYFFE